MPIHDWRQVEAGVFHHFHHAWIEEISRSLNAGLLPEGYYALAEQHAAGFGPDILTLEQLPDDDGFGPVPAVADPADAGGTSLLVAPPKVSIQIETDMEFYRRKQSVVTVRHITGDRMVAVVEIILPGNKSGQKAFRSFLDKAGDLLDRQIHLLVLDLLPPTPRDPSGIHAAIWEEMTGQPFAGVAGKVLTLAGYESALSLKAYVEPVAVGDDLPDMPLYLEPNGYVLVPLSATYDRAFAALPRRWQSVLQPGG
ncbi:MAG: DUF4058 family protein [Patescibacteria group bacterium]|nr:DUF4058 family protein [Patescibacteria group bacterium]